LQLLAVPYSSTHVAEADLIKERDTLISFIQKFSRSHQFKPYYGIEEIQISKAFQAFLAGRPAKYVKEERDAICPSVHDWDRDYSVSVFTAEFGYQQKLSVNENPSKPFSPPSTTGRAAPKPSGKIWNWSLRMPRRFGLTNMR
jgi:hypothetical protein